MHFCCDDAGSNLKAVAWRCESLAQSHKRLLMSRKGCSLHGNDLIKSAAVNMHLPVVSGLYAIAGACRGGTFFQRVVHMLPSIIGSITIVRGHAPASAKAFAEEVVSFAVANFDHSVSRHDSSDGAGGGGRGFRQFIADTEALVDVLNGDWSGSELVHYCSSSNCCSNYSRSVTVRKALQAVVRVLFSSAPGSPEIGKWTLFWGALDHTVMGSLVHKIYNKAFSAAASQTPRGAKRPRLEGVDPCMEHDIAFTEVMGKRVDASVRFLSDVNKISQAVMMAIGLEPVRASMRMFFAFSRGAYSTEQAHSTEQAEELTPGLCIMSSRTQSPIFMLLQYCSSALAAASVPRTQLLFRLLGCSDIHSLYAGHRDVVTAFGDLLLVVAGWIHRRHLCELLAWPWPLAVLGDPNAAVEDKRSIARAWWDTPLCDLDVYFGRRLRETGLVSRWEDLVESRSWQQFFRSWASQVSLTNAQVEFRNARYDRQCPSRCTSVDSFVAKAYHEEARALHSSDRKAWESLRGTASSSGSSGAPADPKVPSKGISALQVYHQHVYRREQACGFTGRCASKEFWAKVRAEWDGLPDDHPEKVLGRLEAFETQAKAKAIQWSVWSTVGSLQF